MRCGHHGFHSICSSYDRRRGVLLFFWTCEGCGKRLGEASRAEYRPRFDPHGHDGVAAPAPAR
jgi:hypothetical protein